MNQQRVVAWILGILFALAFLSQFDFGPVDEFSGEQTNSYRP